MTNTRNDEAPRPESCGPNASFARFHENASNGNALSVVFFGGSIAWGAGASDPQTTSYRALIGQRLRMSYPRSEFQFHDGAIGGTNSQLAAIRIRRDVFAHRPDLVFIDFALNDGMENLDLGTLASFEAVLRRTICEAQAPVVLPLFPYRKIVEPEFATDLPALDARIALAKAYHTPIGDAVSFVRDRIRNSSVTLRDIWPSADDRTHPGDKGYELYARAVWSAFESAVESGVVCTPPDKMVYDDLYMTAARHRFATAGRLPQGWLLGTPSADSPVGDMRMSRWLDSLIVAKIDSDRDAAVEPLRLETRARAIVLFGQSTLRSGKYEIRVDGAPVRTVDAADVARIIGGNAHHFHVVAEFPTASTRRIEIAPLLLAGQELLFESIGLCGADRPEAQLTLITNPLPAGKASHADRV